MRRRWLIAGTAGVAVLAGCQLPGQTDSQPAAERGQPAAVQPAARAEIALQLARQGKQVRPDRPIVVEASLGRLEDVVVSDSQGRRVPGQLGAKGTSWMSTERLGYATDYTVQARAINADGQATDLREQLRTLRPSATMALASVTPDEGDTVGVGMPVIVTFPRPVKNRAAVEQAMQVRGSRPLAGSWNWVADDEVHYRLPQYWPAYTDVTLELGLRGVEVAPGVWGKEDRDISFRIGPSMVSTVDAARHSMTVVRDGRVARVLPITTGRADNQTRSGIKVISARHRWRVMDSTTTGVPRGSAGYYRVRVPYAQRITNTGEFVHGAPWSVRDQGRRNVSHGCVGMSVSNAGWFFSQSRTGDVVRVINTSRRLEPGNGWTDWNVPWEEWEKGSALDTDPQEAQPAALG